MKRVLLVLTAFSLLASCAMMARLGAAGAGAATGSLLGPAGAATGAVIGLASVEVVQAEGEVEEIEERVENIETALTTGDVSNIVAASSQSLIDKVWGWVKLTIVLIIVVFVLSIIYTVKRKMYAGQYYKKIDELLERSNIDE